MILSFYKYTGAGNDFVLFDNRDGRLQTKNQDLWEKLCDRHFGIGADGVVFLEKSSKEGCDYKMVYLNSDGKEASMCGNASRCLLHFAHKKMYLKKEPFYRFETQKSIYSGFINEKNDLVSILMNGPTQTTYPLLREKETRYKSFFFTNTGVPHLVIEVDSVETINVMQDGAYFRHHPLFKPEGTNVNFVSRNSRGEIKMRTFERGVEGETLACGTGAMAVALFAWEKGWSFGPLTLSARGGQLFFEVDEGSSDIWLKGPAICVFQGTIEVL